jgi:iron(III) transport system permease protein
MLALVLYPYVYLLARAVFLSQSGAQFIAARTLGHGPWSTFFRISLPMSRAAAFGGVLLVAMETIADFGTVSFFGVQTFATGIYQSWFSMADRSAAAQLALCLLSFAILLAMLERITRRTTISTHGRRKDVFPRFRLSGWRALGATVLCAAPVLFGALIPTVALIFMAIGSGQDLLSPRYRGFVLNSLTLAVIASALTVTVALALGSARRIFPGPFTRIAFQTGRLGYAVPGGVIAVGLMVPVASFDNWLDALMERTFGVSTGLLISGSITLLLAAYMIRFLAAAISAYESGASAVNPNLDDAARVLGASPLRTALHIHSPLLTPSLLTAALIVFVDVMKELPATLILRPFNFDTLAVQAFRLASDERLNGAAVPSLVIAGLGLIPTILLCRRISRN